MSDRTLRVAAARVLREAGWAPLAVVVLNAIVVPTPYAHDLYWLLHLLGGAALAYFFLKASRVADDLAGSTRPLTGYVLAFSLTCAVAILWEIAEFALDSVNGSGLQENLAETMLDMVFDVAGAIASLAALAVLRA